MNAHTSPQPSVLTDAIVKNVAVLQYLADTPATDRPTTKAGLASAIGKDAANLNRAMKLLTDDGVIVGWDQWPQTLLTDLGARVLHGLRIIDGHVVMPEGDVPANVRMVPACMLVANPDNPRKDWSSERALREDAELKASIARTLGPRLPIEAYPPDENGVQMIEAGERRWRATLANIEDGVFPGDHPVMVITKPRPASEQDMLDAMVEENIQHRQLTYTEEARYFERSIANGRTQEEMATRCKRSLKHVQDYLRLLKHADVLEQLENDEITLQKARAVIAERNNPALFEQHQIPKAKPAAPALETLSPEQAAYNALTTSPRMALIVCELADRTEKEPVSRLAADPLCDFTQIDFAPTDSLAELLIKHGVLMVQRRAGQVFARVVLKSEGSRKWLEDNGFYEGDTARAGLLRQLRYEVDSFAAGRVEQNGLYLTPWLNLPEPELDEHEPTLTVTADQTPIENFRGEDLRREGLVGDSFSQLLRRAREETDDAPVEASELDDTNDQDGPKADLGRSAGQAAEPGSPPAPKPTVQGGVLDAKLIAETARDLSELLQQWRGERGRAHWSTLSDEDMVSDLAMAVRMLRPLMAIAVLAIGRHHFGQAKVCDMLSRAVDAVASGAEG